MHTLEMRNTLHKYPIHAYRCYRCAPQKIIPKSPTQAAVNNPHTLGAAFQSTALRAVGLGLAPHSLSACSSCAELHLLPEFHLHLSRVSTCTAAVIPQSHLRTT